MLDIVIIRNMEQYKKKNLINTLYQKDGLKQNKKLLPLVKITKRKLETPEKVYCVTVNPKHRIVVNQILTSQSPNIQQCLPRYEYLYTNKGYFTFEELFKDYPLGNTAYKGDLRVIDDKGQEDIIERVYRGTSDTLVCFNLSDGSKFECTPDHNCFVMRNDEEIMIKASEILPTDLFIRVD